MDDANDYDIEATKQCKGMFDEDTDLFKILRSWFVLYFMQFLWEKLLIKY